MGRTQREMENDYFLIDLPDILALKRKKDAIERLEWERSFLATNNRALDDDMYTQHVRHLANVADLKPEQKFDREGFEQLRAISKGGGR